MTYLMNQLGESVVACGAPGSIARMACLYPTLKTLNRHGTGWGLVIWYKTDIQKLAWVYDPELCAKYPVKPNDLINPMLLWGKGGNKAVEAINAKNYRLDDNRISSRYILNW